MWRPIRFCGLMLACQCGLFAAGAASRADAADGFGLLLAQANPAPVKLPDNVKKVGRMFVMETVVVFVLIAGSVYAVCRTSRRT